MTFSHSTIQLPSKGITEQQVQAILAPNSWVGVVPSCYNHNIQLLAVSKF